jgi:para-aminobenzoate synthetase/4-amino-4-deoxychorismate lyase
LYTGAIGWFGAVNAADEADVADASLTIGDFCLAIPIRTLVLQALNSDAVRCGEMGVGAGIVYDSSAADEYLECQLKARFLTGLSNEFELFETMYATQADGCRHSAQHLQRLCGSAAYFCFTHDEAQLRKTLQDHCAALPATGPYRVRLALNQAGVSSIQSAPVIGMLDLPVKLLLATQPTMAHDLFLRHKSTVRERYDAAWRKAEAQGAFDMLFCNTRGELTEGGRSNLFIKQDGCWYTPPLSAGVLPGIMRAELLKDPVWDARERRLTLDDLRTAQAVVVCNALRGVLPAIVDWEGYIPPGRIFQA